MLRIRRPLPKNCFKMGMIACAARGVSLIWLALFGLTVTAIADETFVNWESPHVHPLDLTPDQTRLLAVNTADNRLEVFTLSGGLLTHERSIPVGLDPVSVRARNDHEAWVVNHISDSVSIVDLDRGVVIRTVQTQDEPADVVFAGARGRAFVSCSQANSIQIFDPFDLNVAPHTIAIHGEDPRALAVSPDGTTVYAAIFESGNATTILAGGRDGDSPGSPVDDPRGPYRGQNPPPNDGDYFSPAINTANGAAPRVGMIVRKGDDGRWRDDNQGDWTRFVSGDLSDTSARVRGWDMLDRDVAAIDADTLTVAYQRGVMTSLMSLDANPQTGRVAVVGAEAHNEIRYEPNLRSRFVTLRFTDFALGGSNRHADMNSHFDGATQTLPLAARRRSIGDPRGLKWAPDGRTAFVTGMGSNNLLLLDQNGARLPGVNPVAVGEGPTGLAVSDNSARVFVLNRFDGSISVVDPTARREISRVAFFDPTPDEIKVGRRTIYDTHRSSGLGQVACASCHVDARSDRLAWDLGDPSGEITHRDGVAFHPMKGPMRTASLVGIVGSPLLHFRGDRETIADFAETFETLHGLAAPLSDAEMAAMEAFLATIHTPPNPYRNLDNSMPQRISIPGPFERIGTPAREVTGNGCADCHNRKTNARDGVIRREDANTAGGQPAIAPSLRSMYELLGLHYDDPTASTAGFAFVHDGSFDARTRGILQNDDNLAYMLAMNGDLPGDTHAAVGRQVTIAGAPTPADHTLLSALLQLTEKGAIGLVAKGLQDGAPRGYALIGDGLYQSDIPGETILHTELLRRRSIANPMTFTAVPTQSAIRIGIDRNNDGVLDGAPVGAIENGAQFTGNGRQASQTAFALNR